MLSLHELAPIIRFGKAVNPKLRLKINTVVNSLNCNEDMSQFIRNLAPDKWKVLRMLPTVTKELSVADEQFIEFVDRHSALGDIISAEDNSDMVESYIMIDPRGRFFQNSLTEGGYRYSDSILNVGAHAAFQQVSWLQDKFWSRYSAKRSESYA